MVGISGWINWCKGWRQRRFSTLQKNQERDTLRLIPHTSKHGGGVVARILTLQGSWKWDGVGEIIFSPSSSMFSGFGLGAILSFSLLSGMKARRSLAGISAMRTQELCLLGHARNLGIGMLA